MTATQPTRKDIAEFFRLGLLAGVCEPATVVQWAEQIVTEDPRPNIAFIELCVSGPQPSGVLQTLLTDVPGQATPDLPIQMLLGYSSRLIASRAFTPAQLLLRLHRISSVDAFPERIYFELVGLEDNLYLAGKGVYGTLSEVSQHIKDFLVTFEPYTPRIPTGSA